MGGHMCIYMHKHIYTIQIFLPGIGQMYMYSYLVTWWLSDRWKQFFLQQIVVSTVPWWVLAYPILLHTWALWQAASYCPWRECFECLFPRSTKASCCYGSRPTDISSHVHHGYPAARSIHPAVLCKGHDEATNNGLPIAFTMYSTFNVTLKFYTFQLLLCLT